MSLQDAGMPVTDLGIQRGYGIFDFLRVSGNIPLYLDDHLDRFFQSAGFMRLPVKLSRSELSSVIGRLIRENNLPVSGIRMLLTGGESADGYQIHEPNLAVVQQVIPAPGEQWLNKGSQLVSYPFQRQLPHVKTTDYLMAIWLQPWLKENQADDVLYYQEGIVTECPRANIFMVTDDHKLVTPRRNMLKGVTRKQIMGLAGACDLDVEERDIHLSEMSGAKEVFITSSTKRIIPVSRLDDHIFPAALDSSISHRLWAALRAHEMTYIETRS
jgi:D-alanine transaminase/branched-chain amino acid aminotransferase